jgi:hypothetical protein
MRAPPLRGHTKAPVASILTVYGKLMASGVEFTSI